MDKSHWTYITFMCTRIDILIRRFFQRRLNVFKYLQGIIHNTGSFTKKIRKTHVLLFLFFHAFDLKSYDSKSCNTRTHHEQIVIPELFTSPVLTYYYNLDVPWGLTHGNIRSKYDYIVYYTYIILWWTFLYFIKVKKNRTHTFCESYKRRK